MPEAFMVRSYSGLKPADAAGAELLAMLEQGEAVRVKWSKPRNLPRLRWWWALCELIARHSNRTKEQVAAILKISVGHADELHTKGDHCPECGCEIERVIYMPRSIAFGTMDETAFAEFTKQCVGVVTERLIPGANDDDVRRELEEMVG